MKTANTGKDRAHPSYVKILHDMEKRRKQFSFFSIQEFGSSSRKPKQHIYNKQKLILILFHVAHIKLWKSHWKPWRFHI